MNLLETYIDKIISEEDISVEQTARQGLPGQYVRVTAIVHCYGITETVSKIILKDEWTAIKKKGYYLS